jgi:ribosomal silencing factor RsfS
VGDAVALIAAETKEIAEKAINLVEVEYEVLPAVFDIEEALKQKGIRPLGQEGITGGRWILMDYEDVVVHIFLEPVRKFYDLDANSGG